MQKAKASGQQSQQESQNDDAGKGEGQIKNAHFWNALSLAGGHTSSLSNLFPLCKQCAKVALMCWCHHLECIDQEGATQLKLIGPPPLHP